MLLDEHQEFLRLFLLLLITNRDPDVAVILDRVRTEARVRMHELVEIAFEAEGPDVARAVADRLAGFGVILIDGTFLAEQVDGVEGRNRRVKDMAESLEHYGAAIAAARRS